MFPRDGIVLYAKQSGLTSFASLWAIKHALNTTKIGHTGTLDNFADGLLVVLSNRMTKFVSHITGFDKTYEAIIKFGEETDTLDIDGTVIATSAVPTLEQVTAASRAFCGTLEQMPPAFSAIQVNGKRASDLARSGEEVALKSRPVTIYQNEVIAYRAPFAHIRVSCSKGTYIRALARDMAQFCGAKAHLVALRRTAVGPFHLSDAAGFDKLPKFCIENLSLLMSRFTSKDERIEPSSDEIRRAVKCFTPELVATCGLNTVFLKPAFYEDFLCGRSIKAAAFETELVNDENGVVVFAEANGKGSVFNPPRLCGMVQKRGKSARYMFVIQDDAPKTKGVVQKKGSGAKGARPMFANDFVASGEAKFPKVATQEMPRTNANSNAAYGSAKTDAREQSSVQKKDCAPRG